MSRGLSRFVRREVVLDTDVRASRQHAKIVCEPADAALLPEGADPAACFGRCVFFDLGSSRGSRVNGRAVHGRVALVLGDRLTIGGTELRFLADVPPPPETAEASDDEGEAVDAPTPLILGGDDTAAAAAPPAEGGEGGASDGAPRALVVADPAADEPADVNGAPPGGGEEAPESNDPPKKTPGADGGKKTPARPIAMKGAFGL